MPSYENVYAPFDGDVTARNTDVGDLINAGAGTPTTELFHMAATKTLRIYVAVPEIDAPAMQAGATPTVTLDEYPGQMVRGSLVRNSGAINPTSRTLLVEVDVDNTERKLLPGAYVFVHFMLPGRAQSVTVPANALLFRSEGLRVGVVRDGKAVLVPITIGRDYGDRLEVLSGLQPSDQVILNPSELADRRHRRAARGRQTGGDDVMRRTLPGVFGLLLEGCTVGPKYQTPTVPMTDTFKEATPVDYKTAGTWRPAQPSDGIGRGPWWQIFGDPQLNALEDELTVSNQNLKIEEARFRQERALIGYQRAAEFPTISVSRGASGAPSWRRVKKRRPPMQTWKPSALACMRNLPWTILTCAAPTRSSACWTTR